MHYKLATGADYLGGNHDGIKERQDPHCFAVPSTLQGEERGIQLGLP